MLRCIMANIETKTLDTGMSYFSAERARRDGINVREG